MSIILFGFKGVGKTYFGKKLASLTGQIFIDTDKEMLRRCSFSSISKLHEHLGEKNFRVLEEAVVARIPPLRSQIIALGGGTILSPVNKQYLEKIGTLIYLEAPLEKILYSQEVISPTLGCLKTLYTTRLPLYRAITPAHRIDLESHNEQEVLVLLTRYLQGNR